MRCSCPRFWYPPIATRIWLPSKQPLLGGKRGASAAEPFLASGSEPLELGKHAIPPLIFEPAKGVLEVRSQFVSDRGLDRTGYATVFANPPFSMTKLAI